MEHLLCQKKQPFFMENFLVGEKFLWSSKIFGWKTVLILANFDDCGKAPWLRKVFFTVENFLDCGKFIFLTAEKILGLKILKTSASVKTIKTYLLILKQKLILLAFFAVNEINIIFTERSKHK